MRESPRDIANRLLVAMLVLFAAVDAQAQSGRGHSMRTNGVVIEGRRHFENWASAAATVEVGVDGVRPRRLRRHANAALEIVEALRQRPPKHLRNKAKEEIELIDAVQAGSNREDVVNVLDGDMRTYWEPHPPSSAEVDLADEWWFTLDLGRVVFADRLVVRFVGPGQGDPFLLFDVLTSDGQKPISALSGKAIEFLPVIETIEQNRTRRRFEVDLSSFGQEAREALVRFVQVVVRGSNLERGTEVSEREYGRLDAGEKGLVEYTTRLSDTRESAVPEEVYWKLEPERRGSIHYFRRERPRLAELEVWGGGDEILGGTLFRGGTVATRRDITPGDFLDHDLVTAVILKNQTAGKDELVVDLGSSYWVDSQRMATNFRGSGSAVAFSNHELDFSDGRRHPDGSLVWTVAARIERGYFGYRPASNMLIGRHDFDPVKARFFRLLWEGWSNAYLAEMQLFGQGFQPEVWLESDNIEMRRSKNLTEISWEADTPPGTEVVLQTKTGNTVISDTLYYTTDGGLLGKGDAGAKKYYSRAYKNDRGEKKLLLEEGPDWSPLSGRYEDPSGSKITSPSPRKIAKVRATLLSDDPNTAATLHSVRLSFSDPFARRLLGEVMPTSVEAMAVERSFSLYVRVDTLEQRFDELLVRPPAGMVLGEGVDVAQQVHLFSGSAAELEESPGVEVLSYGDSLHLRFPLVDSRVEVLRLDFPATLYSSGGVLKVSLRHSDSEFWQAVDVGDATDEVTSSTLIVVAQPKSRVLFRELNISPRVASPNGDGINDEVMVEFSVVLVGADQTVEVEIRDLSGRLVRRLTQRRDVGAGRYQIAWDGTDDSRHLAPPGLYAVKLGLDADTDGAGLDKKHALLTVALVY